jgi:glycosyltransferase involved in cell wall biosynthesis
MSQKIKSIKVSYIEPISSYGGMNYYDRGLIKGLSKYSCKISFFTSEIMGKNEFADFNVYYTFKGLWQIKNKFTRLFLYLRGIIHSLIITKEKRNCLVHLHLFHFNFLFILTIIITKLFSNKIVLTIHDVEDFSGRKYLLFIEKFIYTLIDKGIVHNQFSYNEAKKRMMASKIKIIPHGNYLPFIKNPSLNLQKNINEKFEMLFFGQIKKVKGLDILLKALGLLKRQDFIFNLTIAGKLWKDDFKFYQTIINEYSLEDNITINLNYIPDEMVSKYFNGTDLVILPYKKIYQSGVLLKAMSYGKVTLVSDLLPFTEIIKDGENGYIYKSEDYRALAIKISEIISNRDRLQNIESNALEYVKKNHDWTEIGRKTFLLYEEICC